MTSPKLLLIPFLILLFAKQGLAQNEISLDLTCPPTPNCVSTKSIDPTHKMDPLPLTTSPEESIRKLCEIILDEPRTKITSSSNNSLHAEFKSFLFRFVDDVYFLIDTENQLIHFKSQSRVGHSDLGVNKKRMIKIIEKFQRPPVGQK